MGILHINIDLWFKQIAEGITFLYEYYDFCKTMLKQYLAKTNGGIGARPGGPGSTMPPALE